jgi:hypothetical protein
MLVPGGTWRPLMVDANPQDDDHTNRATSEPDPMITLSYQAVYLVFAMASCGGAVYGLVGFMAGELIAIRWLVAGTVILAATAAFAAFLISFAALATFSLSEENAQTLGEDREVFYGLSLIFFVVGSVALVVFLSELMRHLFMLAGGFSAPNDGVITWAKYSLQEWIDAASLGSASIYGSLAAVEPTTWWSKTLIVLPYHLVCTLLIIGAAKRGLELYRST